MKHVKIVLMSAVLAMTALSAQVATAQQQLLDRIVAIVEDDIILASEVEARYQAVKQAAEAGGKKLPSEDQVRRDLLDVLIVESIQFQMARRAGVRVSDAQLNSQLARIAAQNKLTLEQFQQILEEQGQYQQAREQIGREILLQQVQQGNVSPRIQITDQEIDNYLESNAGQLETAPEYRLSHILVDVASNASGTIESFAKRTARNVASKLRDGQNYQKVAEKEGLSAADLGWRKPEDIPSLFLDIVKKLKRGEVADPIRSPSGFHIIKMEDQRGVKEIVSQTKASHILLKPSAIRSEKETEALASEIREKIINGEKFHQLAKAYSEDIGSAAEGGELGWTNRGQLVPEFQEAMDKLAIGAISPAVKSRYGWHIITVEGRREKDITDDLRRNLARNIIHQRKFKEELDIWLRKIRSEAYVDIKQ